jgi:hypothetical protein
MPDQGTCRERMEKERKCAEMVGFSDKQCEINTFILHFKMQHRVFLGNPCHICAAATVHLQTNRRQYDQECMARFCRFTAAGGL